MTIAKMATRIPSNVGVGSQEDCTEFQLHKSQMPEFDSLRGKIADFTEHRLTRYVKGIEDLQQRVVLLDLLSRYRKGFVAVAWKRGRPVYVIITKEK